MNCPKCNLRMWSIDKGICPNPNCSDKVFLKEEEELPPPVPKEVIEVVQYIAPESSGIRTLDAVLKDHILRVIEHCEGNKSEAARILGISIKTLYNKLEMWGKHTKLRRKF